MCSEKITYRSVYGVEMNYLDLLEFKFKASSNKIQAAALSHHIYNISIANIETTSSSHHTANQATCRAQDTGELPLPQNYHTVH